MFSVAATAPYACMGPTVRLLQLACRYPGSQGNNPPKQPQLDSPLSHTLFLPPTHPPDLLLCPFRGRAEAGSPKAQERQGACRPYFLSPFQHPCLQQPRKQQPGQQRQGGRAASGAAAATAQCHGARARRTDAACLPGFFRPPWVSCCPRFPRLPRLPVPRDGGPRATRVVAPSVWRPRARGGCHE